MNRYLASTELDLEEVFLSKVGKGIFFEKNSIIEGNAIFIASYFGHANLVEKLINYAKSKLSSKEVTKLLNIRNFSALGHNLSAIDVAAANGHLDVVEVLLQNNALTNHTSEEGRGDVLDFLRSEADISALCLASKAGHFDIMERLIRQGVHQITISKAFSVAAENGQFKACQYLLDQGADVNFEDNDVRQTPLTHALENKHYKIAELLIERGANIDKVREYYSDRYYLNEKNKESLSILLHYASSRTAPAIDSAAEGVVGFGAGGGASAGGGGASAGAADVLTSATATASDSSIDPRKEGTDLEAEEGLPAARAHKRQRQESPTHETPSESVGDPKLAGPSAEKDPAKKDPEGRV